MSILISTGLNGKVSLAFNNINNISSFYILSMEKEKLKREHLSDDDILV